MSTNNKYTFKKILVISVWILLASGLVVLLVAAISKKNNARLSEVQINISGVQNNYFISEKDVLNILQKVHRHKLDQSSIGSLNLSAMETALEKNDWIKKAEMFVDNNNVLQIKIKEREPIARIFTNSGASFYIDSSLTMLPLSDKFSARLPVFTSFPTEVKVLKKQDSVLLNEVKNLSEYINAHPFWMAQIDQIDITTAASFEMIPKLGNQVIRFGNADNCAQKFNKLLAFYEKVQTKLGWNKYSVLDVQFKDQVIGVNRNAAEIKSDSLRSVLIMKTLIAEAKRNSNDSTKIQLPAPSENNNDNNDNINNSPVLNVPTQPTDENKIQVKPSEIKISAVAPIQDHEKPLLKKHLSTESKSVIRHPSSNERPHPTPAKNAAVKKEVEKPNEQTNPVPKAVMPAKSDY
jgi:cell division protein FtsQ